MSRIMILTRRELLDLAVRAAALPGAAAFFSPWFSHGLAQQNAGPGAYAPPEPPTLKNYKPAFFAAEDFEALRAFTEILIPTDDTPGAREAFCAHYIDFVLQAAATAGQSQNTAAAMARCHGRAASSRVPRGRRARPRGAGRGDEPAPNATAPRNIPPTPPTA